MRSHPLDSDNNNAGEKALQAVGQWLQRAREQQGESLENVARITRIGKNYLEAVEEGAADKLPNQAYTRGFIRLYAAHLGLSPDEALRIMNGQAVEALHQGPVETRSVPPADLPAQQQAVATGKSKKKFFAVISAVALAVIVIILVGRTSQQRSSTGSQTVSAVPSPAGTAPAPAAAPPMPKTDTPPATAVLQQGNGEVAKEEGIILRLKAVSGGRLHITIDGSISQEYELVAGDLVEWKADKMFLLDLENASSVEGELDGKPLKPFGEAGRAAHLIIRQHGVQND